MFINQFGYLVADVCKVDFYQSDSSSSDIEVGYDVNVSWIFGKDVHEQLEVIRCI